MVNKKKRSGSVRKTSYSRAGRRSKSSRTRPVVSSMKGMLTPIIAGALASIGGQFASRYLGAWGTPVATGASGYFFKNHTLMTIAGMQAGSMVNLGSIMGGNTPSAVSGAI